jgi:hypothetical protein
MENDLHVGFAITLVVSFRSYESGVLVALHDGMESWNIGSDNEIAMPTIFDIIH